MAKAKKAQSGHLTVTEYARRRGVSHVAVIKAVKTGRISKTPDGFIDPEKADQDWAANTDPSKPLNSVSGNPKHRKTQGSPKIPGADVDAASTASAGGVPPYLQSRAIREAYEARLSKLDYEVRTGKLVSADEVKVIAFNTGRMARDKLMNMPDRLAPLLAGISDGHEIHRLLSAEIRLICEELSSDANKSNRSHIP
ncbi:MAG: hypothetical protein HZB85_01780 [Deltaproteobacteria bacterium]|nr:hypothetical protein [Deltaproteobacteria bacterium]